LNTPDLNQACTKVSEILRSSARSTEGFAVFMLSFSKKSAAAEAITPAVEPAPTKAGKKTAAPKIPDIPSTPIYAPMPEDLDSDPVEPETPMSLPGLPKLSIPKISFKPRIPKFNINLSFLKLKFFPKISGPGKFFLASFLLFAVLFTMNIAAFGVRKSQSRQAEQFNAISETFVNYLAEAESSLLYKNHSQAMKLMSSAETELAKLKELDDEKAAPFAAKFEEMNNKVNRVTVLRNLTPAFETPYPASILARAGNGYLISNENPNSLGVYAGNELKNLFMLNSTDGDLRGITHVSGIGNFVATKDKVYLANESSKEFQQLEYVSNGDLHGLKFLDPNRIYAINKTTNQVIRMTASARDVSAPTNLLKTNVNLKDAQDLAVDTDIYILYPDGVTKFSGTGQPVNFQLSSISEPARQMTKIRVGNQIYLLEPVSNRLLIFSRTGELLNQVQFPELNDLKDMYVDEGQRQMLLLNGNRVYMITF
jgi:hypothetical protein